MLKSPKLLETVTKNLGMKIEEDGLKKYKVKTEERMVKLWSAIKD